MHAIARQTRRLRIQDIAQLSRAIPVFLCPALASCTPATRNLRRSQDLRVRSFTSIEAGDPSKGLWQPIRELPAFCPGCGAPTQASSPESAGFYNTRRHRLKKYLYGALPTKQSHEDDIFEAALKRANTDVSSELAALSKNSDAQKTHEETLATPVCERCNGLLNHNNGQSIYHPSIQSIEEMIADSPHKYNHIYHVIDAADFPMSLIPNLQHTLKMSPLRSQNRRSKERTFHRGRVAEVSFIITRSDLLGAVKEDVDKLMPWAIEVLRDALGRRGANVRLGNVHLVSAKRGWWTPVVKQEIWDRGGAGWLVGKANVGKSNLFEVVYPKGHTPDSAVNVDAIRQKAQREALAKTLQIDILSPVLDNSAGPDISLPSETDSGDAPVQEYSPAQVAYMDMNPSGHENPENVATPGSTETETDPVAKNPWLNHDPDSLLPPPQVESKYPTLPMVSHLPGTTAAPIRIPFGGGKGELIDLPGLARSDLETYVKPEHRIETIMKAREAPQKIVIRPGQSLLLGGLIRITPTDPDLIYIAHPFVTLDPHLTATEKAIELQHGTSNLRVPTITTDSAGQVMRLAGSFPLKWDVTNKQTGTLTAKDAGKRKAADLPFIIYSTDIVIEGMGWVEITCQVRKRRQEATQQTKDSFEAGLFDDFADSLLSTQIDPATPRSDSPFAKENNRTPARNTTATVYPEVEVFSPKGKHIATRRTMNGSIIGGKKPTAKHLRKTRPPPNMSRIKGSQAGFTKVSH